MKYYKETALHFVKIALDSHFNKASDPLTYHKLSM